MGLLRFLLSLPLYLLRGIGWLLSHILGRIAWQPPGWLRAIWHGLVRLGASMRARPGRAAGVIAAVLVLSFSGWFGYKAWRDRPKPIEEKPAALKSYAPMLTGYDDTTHTLVVHPLRVEFTRAAAPLALVGKTVTAGITMQPELAGTWTWLNDRELQFMPKDDWPIGQAYDVRFDPAQAFAPHVKVDKDRLNF